MTTAQLRTLARATTSIAGSGDALIELVAREPRGLDRFLQELAVDDRIDQSLRLQAVTTLGRNTSPSSLQGLRAALTVDDPDVEQRAIERLGKVGTADDIELLRQRRSGNRTTQRVLRTAKSFLSYRHRLGTYRIDAPKNRIAAADDAADPIRTTTPTSKMIDRIELATPPVPGINLVPTPLRRLVCGGGEYALMWNSEFGGAAAATLADQQGIPAVLVEFNNETGVYSPSYYLFADPTGHGRVRLAGLRGSGHVGLVGSATIDADQLRFEINATETPIEHPLTVSGSYDLDSAAVRFEVANVESRFSQTQQRRRKRPRLVRQPS